ncbi:bifunctional nitrate reductase/sulfite reductase flavoprotein subunit alpha [Kutzneria kofuensis]|uniref:assimilatory sulfite reductase (NADPH) n=1 Tax=Kutzneria kofuensis TaxID=103725 RepID=A0A7W9NJ11_9PSEU|nr:bifunctional nitrate reductase/sulfite reductase flavoprotein subunit alpha [Kutzneria kofuensis]MBB5895177.1 anaerobic selenocysteine-containing dehydrogenase/sulfite reductase alpha subunit-like flavoprotein [Kutzneria kofuensis]
MPDSTVRTVCSYCGVGCGIVLTVRDDRVVSVAGDKDHPANLGRLCTKGATSHEMLAAPGRLTTALVRADREAPAEPTDVDRAITLAATKLRAILDEHGPDALSFYVSGQLTLEAQYLITKLAKGFVRTNQLESNSRLCMASAGSGYKLSLGADGPPGSYEDFEHADVFLVIGSNMADCHPILYLRLMDRVKRGAKLIVVDPRRTATAAKADLFLQIAPGTDLALLNGLLHLIHADGLVDEEFVAAHTEGWEAMPEFLADYPPDVVARITGIPEDDIRTAARWIGAAGNWMSCWTMGLNQSTHGTWNTNALCNLHLATGAICRPGSGPFSLTGQPNAMGGREMGYMGPGLPGQRSVLSTEDRAFVEELWEVPPGTIRTEVGRGTVEMFERMADGDIKACWIICTNPVASVANRRTVIEGLEAAELVITQDAFADTETNGYADIVLPGAIWSEVEGVMVNSERNVTLARRAVSPAGQALPDWQLIARVAVEMGFPFHYDSAEEIFEEIKRFGNPFTGYDLRGITYSRLRETPVQWPSAPDGPARNPIRYVTDESVSFPTASGKAVFFARPHLPAAELPDDEFPFTLNTGRVQHQWHTLTKTGKVAKLNRLNPGPFLELHPSDAADMSIVDGDQVEIASRRGRAVLPAVVTDRVRPGCCFAPFHWNDLFGEYLSVNAVTNDAVDPISFQPEFKVCAVSLAKVAAAAAPGGSEPGGDVPPAWTIASAASGASVSPGSAASAVAAAAAGFAAGASGVAAAGGPGGQVATTERTIPLAAMLGVDDVPMPDFTSAERQYLAGFASGVTAGGVGVPVLPPHAPIEPTRAAWVDGLLAGMYSRGGAAPEPLPGKEIAVLWASQTGNAEQFAAEAARRLAENGWRPVLVSMAEASAETLRTGNPVLLITSTFGDGDAPDNGVTFWDHLSTQDTLAGLQYAVLAFGDSSYDNFCGHGKRIDQRLRELGATHLVPRVDCEPDYQATARRWLDQVIVALNSSPARHREIELVGNRLLSLPGAGKEVREFTFDAGDLVYETGDALSVLPVNSTALVDEWLDVTGLDGSSSISLEGLDFDLGDALRDELEIARITPSLLHFVAEHNGDRELRHLLRPDNKGELAKWAWGRHAVDVLREYPVRADAQAWAEVLKRLQPRQYSISSSPLVSPSRIRLTVSVVRYGSHGGVCSTYLADRAAGSPVKAFIQRSPHFRPPADPSAPMIMVGPGTGIAPFLGFLEERAARGAGGPNWLFFGEQRRATDFYYRDELSRFRSDGLLSRLDLAFSRDQRAKVYVQDRMREHGAHLWRWLKDGAHVYVCGDATRMAKDVDRTLREIVATHGGMTTDQATAYLKQLATDRRYLRDVY